MPKLVMRLKIRIRVRNAVRKTTGQQVDTKRNLAPRDSEAEGGVELPKKITNIYPIRIEQDDRIVANFVIQLTAKDQLSLPLLMHRSVYRDLLQRLRDLITSMLEACGRVDAADCALIYER